MDQSNKWNCDANEEEKINDEIINDDNDEYI